VIIERELRFEFPMHQDLGRIVKQDEGQSES
jgi:hypothetical protein